MSFLDTFLDARIYDAEITHLGTIGYSVEVRAALSQTERHGVDVDM
jgi:hypothetical protein